MMDQVLAVRRNPHATFDDLAKLGPIALKMIRERFGENPRRWPISVYGPLAGLLDGVRKHPEYHAWARRRSLMLKGIVVWAILNIMGVKKRPGYNDFLLTRWTLLGDEQTALELIERSKREDSIGVTACWALRSLSSQYPEFHDRFYGHIPAPHVEDMLKDAPKGSDPEAVLRRSRQVFGGSSK
jgi:hypothetical protein